MNNYNRMYNCKNPFQGSRKRILCVCSAGLLRSPTAAYILSLKPYGFNTRAAGLDIDHALIPVDEVLLEWADDIVCMNSVQKHDLVCKLKELKLATKKRVINLDVPDRYEFRAPGLVRLMKAKFKEIFSEEV